MSIIRIDQKKLDDIANMYNKTSGEEKKMWEKKWYELIKQIGRKLEDETKRSTTNT
mgnify:CR=1 FL=1|jgi:hypothetical protein